ncbi:MAG: acetyl-CoA carboxylase biotin carboxyl carrier protein [Bacteriovoracaceae bacterium]|jgi:acetyl-CoA carboxylase biotin carboxyl carrier protein|nr:acetyl-CoA carboxylase biotin carboxyl carrier protein [Bacteriovoracaceae bacterium]
MTFEKLEQFIKLAKNSGVSSLKYESKDEKYSVSLGQVIAPATTQVLTASPVIEPANKQLQEAIKADGLLEVTCPFVGTFYRSASPGSDPYVKVGDKVSAGQVLCIVEAMKIMNEIESEVSGEVIEICVENENYVEFGQVLYRVKP